MVVLFLVVIFIIFIYLQETQIWMIREAYLINFNVKIFKTLSEKNEKMNHHRLITQYETM